MTRHPDDDVVIPLADLLAQYTSIKGELDQAALRVLASGQFALGPKVAAFEEEFASYCGTQPAIAVNSGTSVLRLALASRRSRPRRRSHHHPLDVYRHCRGDSVYGCYAGLRRHRSADVHHGCQSGRRRHNSPNESGHPCPSLWSPRGSRVSTEPRGRPSHYCH